MDVYLLVVKEIGVYDFAQRTYRKNIEFFRLQ